MTYSASNVYFLALLGSSQSCKLCPKDNHKDCIDQSLLIKTIWYMFFKLSVSFEATETFGHSEDVNTKDFKTSS